MTLTRSVAAVPLVIQVTLRQLLGRRRTILLLLLAAVPVLLSIVFWAAGHASVHDFAVSVLDAVGVTLLLPIVAVLFGTAAFGAEIEDGTIVYLLAKPISRWAIVVAKLVGAAGMTALLTVASVFVSGAIVLAPLGEDGAAATRAFVAAMIVGSICYVSVFLVVSLFTRRALLIGLAYVLIWEGALSNLLPGIANLSIRQYSVGVANAFWQMTPEEARLSPSTALPLAVVVVVVALVIATWRLMRFELPGGSD
ncbi:MAG TPA: ABC transporter permease subunit [Candidatus Limnocylindrales bacterium]